MTILSLEKRNNIKMDRRNNDHMAVWSTTVSKESKNEKLTK